VGELRAKRRPPLARRPRLVCLCSRPCCDSAPSVAIAHLRSPRGDARCASEPRGRLRGPPKGWVAQAFRGWATSRENRKITMGEEIAALGLTWDAGRKERKGMLDWIRSELAREEGQALVEYALIVP